MHTTAARASVAAHNGSFRRVVGLVEPKPSVKSSPPATTMWNTRFTAAFPCRLPLMGAPMADTSGGLLAAETCRAGALGFIGAGHLASTDDLDREIEEFRRGAPRGAPLCLGFIGHSSLRDADGRSRVERTLREHRPEVVQFFAPAVVRWGETDNVALARGFGCRVIAQVGSEGEGREALDAGADCLIAQGTEAGGHGLGRGGGCGTLPLAARLAALARERERGAAVPVLAAGGIVDGRGLAAALALGCDGAVLGTRLWASREALGDDSAKARLADPDIGPDDAVRTTVVDRIANTYHPTPWPEPYDSSGILRNDTAERWHRREGELDRALSVGGRDGDVAVEYRRAAQEGDYKIAAVYAGKGVGEIVAIEGAYDIVTRINREALDILQNLPKLIVSPEE